MTAVVLTVMGAHLLDRHRFAEYRRAAELESSEAFAKALLWLGQALNEVVSKPETLAQRLNEHTRRALAADWAVLFDWDETGQSFRLAAESGAPAAVADELNAVGFSPRVMPAFYRALTRAGTVFIGSDSGMDLFPASLRARWGAAAFASQAISRGSGSSPFAEGCSGIRAGSAHAEPVEA